MTTENKAEAEKIARGVINRVCYNAHGHCAAEPSDLYRAFTQALLDFREKDVRELVEALEPFANSPLSNERLHEAISLYGSTNNDETPTNPKPMSDQDKARKMAEPTIEFNGVKYRSLDERTTELAAEGWTREELTIEGLCPLCTQHVDIPVGHEPGVCCHECAYKVIDFQQALLQFAQERESEAVRELAQAVVDARLRTLTAPDLRNEAVKEELHHLDTHCVALIAKHSKKEELYPCDECGKLRTKEEGGTTFTVCDDCWDKHSKKGAK